jgi:hypothetical protein
MFMGGDDGQSQMRLASGNALPAAGSKRGSVLIPFHSVPIVSSDPVSAFQLFYARNSQHGLRERRVFQF